MKSTIILGGQGGDMYYELGLVKGLINDGLSVDVIGNNAMSKSEVVMDPRVSFYNLREDQDPSAAITKKILIPERFVPRLEFPDWSTKICLALIFIITLS